MSERHVVLGVSGSIAAYKAVDLASKPTDVQPDIRSLWELHLTQTINCDCFRATATTAFLSPIRAAHASQTIGSS
jgi:hypothetical protein